jgi:phenylalanyl-tRNA synthetase alpha subunit
MEGTQAAGEGLTFEKVWATIQETAQRLRELGEATDRRIAETDRQMAETDRRMAESRAETDRRMAESRAETDRQMAESRAETDRQIAKAAREIEKLSKNVGGINNSFGKWAEEIVSANLWEKFDDMGYAFTHGGPRKYRQGKRTVCQVDMLLENGDYAMPVEIKSVLSKRDVDDHLERLERVRVELEKRGDHRKLVGAVAGMVVEEEALKYAQAQGLYVLVQSGDSIEVAATKKTFQAREW